MDFNDEYQVGSTSRGKVNVGDIEIDETCEADIYLYKDEQAHRGKFRRAIRPVLLRHHPHNPDAQVKISVMLQRRHNGSKEWRNDDTFVDAKTLTGGEQIRVKLGFRETLLLYRHLRRLYAICENGIPDEVCNLRVIDGNESCIVEGKRKEAIEQLLNDDPEFFEMVEDLRPGLLENLGKAKLYFARRKSVEDFQEQLSLSEAGRQDWKEGDWDRFFRDNQWIFGYGLCYKFLSLIHPHPYLGNKAYDNCGGQIGDGLMATEAAARFTVLVEIKTPETKLVGALYRSGAHCLSDELSGAVAQLQANCQTWATEGSQDRRNVLSLDTNDIYTCQPKGILVIGNIQELDTDAKLFTFERFRRNLHNPEIITYDELLARARFMVDAQDTATPSSASGTGLGTEEELRSLYGTAPAEEEDG